MSIKHSIVTVGTTATDLTSAAVDTHGWEDITRTICVQNNTAVTVYLGGPGVTTANFGHALLAGTDVTLDLTLSDVLYAVVATGTQNLHLLHLAL